MTSDHNADTEPAARPIHTQGWAWGLCWLMFACTVLNYMDRQAMTVVGPLVQSEFQLDAVGFGWVLAAFQLAYAFFQWPAGALVDRWDVRRTYAAAVTWWSLAGLAAAFAPTLGVLLACRALLGVGESFNWPCALRVTAGVLPPADRSLGNGIFNSGAAIGAVLTPLLVVPLAYRFGWRIAFAILGVCGLIWVAAWLTLTAPASRRAVMAPVDRSEDAPAVGLSARARRAFGALAVFAVAVAASGFWIGLTALLWSIAVIMFGVLVIARSLPMEDLDGARWARSLAIITRLRRFWVMVVVGVTINVSWHFLVSWMANFFQKERGLGLLIGGMVTAIPFLAADVGNLVGGGAVRRLVARGVETIAARKLVLCACMLLIGCAVGVGIIVASSPRGTLAAVSDAPSYHSVGEVAAAALAAIQRDGLILLLLSLAALGAAAYMVNYFAFGQDVAPEHTGLVIGYLGGLGNLFAAGFMPLAGWISMGAWGFTPNFILIGLLPLVGLTILLLAWDRPDTTPEAPKSV